MSPLSFQFGTVGSPNTMPKKSSGSVGAIQYMVELGLDSLELGWVRSVRVSEKTCSEIKMTAEARGISLSVHAPYYINLNADEDEWPKSRKRLMDAAQYGFLAGATDIIFHPGSYFGKPAQEVMPIVLNRLSGCVEDLRLARVDVTLRPETMGKSAMLGSIEDTIEMSQELTSVKPCLDFAHLHARTGDGTMNTYDEWVRLLEFYSNSLGEPALRNLHCHISGIEYSDKGEREHLPIEQSDLDYRALFQALHEFSCGGRILTESPEEALEGDARLLKKVWMEISGETENK